MEAEPAARNNRNQGKCLGTKLGALHAALDEVMSWQSQQVDEFYSVVFLDALRIKVRDGGWVVNKSVYMAIGVDLDGIKHILGFWIVNEEGTSFGS